MNSMEKNFSISRYYIALLWFTGVSLACGFSFSDPDNVTFRSISCNYTGISVVITSRVVFKGVVYTQSNYFNPSCRYLPPSIGTKVIDYFIPLTDCGNLLREIDGYIELSNTIIMQPHRVVETDSDIVQNVSCKFPVFNEIDIEGYSHESQPTRFENADIESWMDFYSGIDILGIDLPNKLLVGDEFSLVIHLKHGGAFKDLQVDRCWAHDKETVSISKYVIPLFDVHACRYSDWISNFVLSKGLKNISDTMVFGMMKAFKFPNSKSLHITCSVQVCRIHCENYCDMPASKRPNSYLTRSKRSNFELNPDRTLRQRHRLMKATIAALGARLMERNKGLSENDTGFIRRYEPRNNRSVENSIKYKNVLNKTKHEDVPDETGLTTVGEATVTGAVVFTKVYKNLLIRTGDLNSTQTAKNDVYNFNLTNNIDVFTEHAFNFRHEYQNKFSNPPNCVTRSRYAVVAGALSFITVCLIFVCIGLIFCIRKEKKNKTTDNFLLYNFY